MTQLDCYGIQRTKLAYVTVCVSCCLRQTDSLLFTVYVTGFIHLSSAHRKTFNFIRFSDISKLIINWTLFSKFTYKKALCIYIYIYISVSEIYIAKL